MASEDQKINVFCAMHATVFTASREKSELLCAEGHTLPNRFPREGHWAYCCACQTFWESGSEVTTECEVCARPPAIRYLCHECKVLSIESSSPGRKQKFSLTNAGKPDPQCPGCLSPAPAKLHYHNCARGDFFTAHQVCPFCSEDLAPPQFVEEKKVIQAVAPPPTEPGYIFDANFRKPVAVYLDRLPAATLRVSPALGQPGIFEKDETGSYWLTPYREADTFIAFPQARQFTDNDDYHSWAAGFECAQPGKGEVWVVSPAVLKYEISTQKWVVLQKGRLEVLAVQAQVSPPEITNLSETREESQINSTPAAGEFIKKNQTALLVAGGVALLIVIIGAVVFISGLGFASKVAQALAKSDPFSVPDNVADIYNEEAAKSPNSPTLKEAGEKIKKKLEPMGEEAMQSYYDESNKTIDWNKAEKIYELLNKISPNNNDLKARLSYCHGKVTFDNKEYYKAQQHYQNSLKEKPNWVLPLNGLGAIHIRQDSPLKNERKAVAYYEEAIQADPKFPWAYSNLSEYYQRYKNWGQAQYYMGKALELKPQRPSFLRAMGWIKKNLNSDCEAGKYYEESLRYETDPVQKQKTQEKLNDVRCGD